MKEITKKINRIFKRSYFQPDRGIGEVYKLNYELLVQ